MSSSRQLTPREKAICPAIALRKAGKPGDQTLVMVEVDLSWGVGL
eukprot:gene11899-15138_t